MRSPRSDRGSILGLVFWLERKPVSDPSSRRSTASVLRPSPTRAGPCPITVIAAACRARRKKCAAPQERISPRRAICALRRRCGPSRTNRPLSARPWSIRELDAPQNRGRPLPPHGALLFRVFLATITPNSRSVDRGCVRTRGDCWSQRLGPRSAHAHRSTYHEGRQADLLVPARL